MNKNADGLLQLLRSRRSIRKFRKRRVDEKTLMLLKEALLRSPSSRGINHREYIFVDDPVILKKLSTAKHGSQFLQNSPLAITICGNETESDVWVEDCAIASITVQLAAHSLKLGSCWAQIRNRKHNETMSAEQYVRGILNTPPNLRILSIIGVGFPAEKKRPIADSKLDYRKFHVNGFLNGDRKVQRFRVHPSTRASHSAKAT